MNKDHPMSPSYLVHRDATFATWHEVDACDDAVSVRVRAVYLRIQLCLSPFQMLR